MIIRYSSEAERKRADYVLEMFSGRIRAEKPSGTVVIIRDESGEISSLLEELYSRLPEGSVEVYRIEEADTGVEPKKAVYTLRTSMTVEEALGAMAAIMASMKGALVSSAGGVRTYILNLRGGRVTARVEASNSGVGSVIRVELEGYGKVFERAREALARRLSLVGEVSVA